MWHPVRSVVRSKSKFFRLDGLLLFRIIMATLRALRAPLLFLSKCNKEVVSYCLSHLICSPTTGRLPKSRLNKNHSNTIWCEFNCCFNDNNMTCNRHSITIYFLLPLICISGRTNKVKNKEIGTLGIKKVVVIHFHGRLTHEDLRLLSQF